MLNKLRNNYNTNYLLERNEYYFQRLFPNSPSFFTRIFRSGANSLEVQLPISFQNVKFGSSPRDVSVKLGNPRYTIKNSGISSQVYFYKEKIDSHFVIAQLHFMEDELFYAGYVFPYENMAEKQSIKNILFEKYAGSSSADFEKYNSLIDPWLNRIYVFDNVSLNILYIWGNEKVKHAIYSSDRSRHFVEAVEEQKFNEVLMSKL